MYQVRDDAVQCLVGDIRELQRQLRRHYYETAPPRKEPFRAPPNMYSGEVLGPWPVYILHSYPCAHFLRGKCTPCAFSLIPRIDAPKAEIHLSLLDQCDRVLSRFDDLVVRRQTRKVPFPRYPDSGTGSKRVLFGFTTTGTFLGENEVPPDIAVELLRRIAAYASQTDYRICINIETRAEDVIARYRDGTLDRIQPFTSEITIMNSIGLESVNDLTRNVIYDKDLELSDFEEAVAITKEVGMVPNSFVYAGWFALSRCEALRDIAASIQYLYSMNVSPIITLPNLYPLTIPHLLFKFGRLGLPDPRDVVALVGQLVEMSRMEGVPALFGDPWYIGMGDQDPNPLPSIFSNPGRATCDSCTTKIRDAVREVRRDYNTTRFFDVVRSTEACSCMEGYLTAQEADDEPTPDILQRVRADIDFAWSRRAEYLQTADVIAFCEDRGL